jgi:hypothetical protein
MVPVAGKNAGGRAFIIYQMSNHMSHSTYDDIGELFRRRLENHRMPVDNGWDEIERRMEKRKKNKAAIWLWRAGVMAAAAAIAALVVFSGPTADEVPVMTVSQQATPEEPATTGLETASVPMSGEADMPQVDVPNPAPNHTSVTLSGTDRTSSEAGFANLPESSEPGDRVSDAVDRDGLPVVAAEIGREQPEEDEPVVARAEKEIPGLDISLVEDKPDEEEPDTEKKKKWLLAAAFGTGGYTDGLSNTEKDAYYGPEDSPEWDGLGSGNQYATDLSGSIRSFNSMAREDFSSISHHTPLSFGLTVRKSLGKHAGIESGLVYTCLSSRFRWEDYDVHQSLHYAGIPVNMAVYLWQARPNWRIYLSGGFTVEKGLRAIYRQNRRLGNEIRTTTVRSSIDGLQWSLNGGLGINYRFNRGFGIYFEPRAGYAFDCGQPISMRTEWPIFVGINMGLNYEF